MSEKLPKNNEGMGQKNLKQEAYLNLEEFLKNYENKLADYAQGEGLYFTLGDGWNIDLKKGKITADGKFFLDRKFSQPESIIAAMHEIEHFRRMKDDLQTSNEIFSHIGVSKRKHTLYNVMEDIFVNRAVMLRKPTYKDTFKELYKNKLFKENDYSKNPKHIQFVNAILREAMVPEEICNVDPIVRTEIDKLTKDDINIIDLLSNPNNKVSPELWFKAVKEYIEPIYDNLFTEDVKERQEQKSKGGGKQQSSEDQGQKPTEKEAEDWFEDDYDELENKMPPSISDEDIQKEIKEAIAEEKEEEITPEEREEKAFERANGIIKEEYNRYLENYYEKVKPYIEEMIELFRSIISKREEVFLKLKRLTDEGVILHPGLTTQAYIDKTSGISQSPTELTYQKEIIDENKPTDFEMTLVCDLSGSMDGEKLKQQKLATTLVLEALQEFEDELKIERENKKINLQVFSEVRAFSDEDYEIKPLSSELSVGDCVNTIKKISRTIGGTSDFLSLEKINKTLDEKKIKDIFEGNLKKIVIVLSDGESADKSRVMNNLKKLRDKGVIVIGVGMTKSAMAIKNTYKPEAQVCLDVSKLPILLKELLEKYLSQF